MDIKGLLTRFIQWALGQSKQLTESRIVGNNDLYAPGIRLMKLNRRTPRAVSTWHIICYGLGYNLELGCETLRHVDGVPPIQKTNKLATHNINIVRIYYEVTIDPRTGKRRPRKEVLLNEECILERAFSESRIDYAPIIFDEAIKLLYRKPDTYKVDEVNWKFLFTEVARVYLRSEMFQVFLEKPTHSDDYWVG